MMIEKGKTVSINYKLTVDGKVVDSSEGKEPLKYVQGEGRIISGLENALEGMQKGDKKEVVVAPEDAYGLVNEQAIVDIPKDNFSSGQETLQPGMNVQAQSQSGMPLNGVVLEVKDDTVKIDFNHPLAGKELSFAVEVVDVV
jgi:FKBP-type peptidyl-prolyl cis-trans isomerase SlyD